jgi:hypothetical protein
MRCSLVFLLLAGCGAPDKGSEEAPLFDLEKDDSFAKPTDHGLLAFGEKAIESLDSRAQYHAWTFALSGRADLVVQTSYGGRGTPDTVLYLYKKTARGTWGSYLAKNDDAGESTWSRVQRSLDQGEYRIIVKGFNSREVGRFAVTATCAGAGCGERCLFGSTFGDLSSHVKIGSPNTITSGADLTELTKRQIVRALHASSHTDVTTLEEAFAAVDGGEINLLWINDEIGARVFLGVEYGAGDNSYGAIFPYDSAEPAALIHDGDLEQCTVQPETCILGMTYHDLRQGSAFTIQSEKVLSATSSLTQLEKDQVLAAVRESYSEVKTLAEAFAAVDQDVVNQVAIQDKATGKRFTVYEYGAGDNSYGAIFVSGSVTRAAAIHDGDFYQCSSFR